MVYNVEPSHPVPPHLDHCVAFWHGTVEKRQKGFTLDRLAMAFVSRFSVFLFLLFLAGCGEDVLDEYTYEGGTPACFVGGTWRPYTIRGIRYNPQPFYEYSRTGVASWYGPGFHLKRTATNEIYHQDGLTAAHRTLPLPCWVRVTNIDNGKSLIVKVNDRGPYINPQKRIIDLSRGAAKKLGILQRGLGTVRVESLVPESMYYIQQLRTRYPHIIKCPRTAQES